MSFSYRGHRGLNTILQHYSHTLQFFLKLFWQKRIWQLSGHSSSCWQPFSFFIWFNLFTIDFFTFGPPISWASIYFRKIANFFNALSISVTTSCTFARPNITDVKYLIFTPLPTSDQQCTSKSIWVFGLNVYCFIKVQSEIGMPLSTGHNIDSLPKATTCSKCHQRN